VEISSQGKYFIFLKIISGFITGLVNQITRIKERCYEIQPSSSDYLLPEKISESQILELNTKEIFQSKAPNKV
jgi:Na+-translocating ferredoxin:NAD+ oxidoreductase RnfG subunit